MDAEPPRWRKKVDSTLSGCLRAYQLGPRYRGGGRVSRTFVIFQTVPESLKRFPTLGPMVRMMVTRTMAKEDDDDDDDDDDEDDDDDDDDDDDADADGDDDALLLEIAIGK